MESSGRCLIIGNVRVDGWSDWKNYEMSHSERIVTQPRHKPDIYRMKLRRINGLRQLSRAFSSWFSYSTICTIHAATTLPVTC
jgi:hypothetical protein